MRARERGRSTSALALLVCGWALAGMSGWIEPHDEASPPATRPLAQPRHRPPVEAGPLSIQIGSAAAIGGAVGASAFSRRFDLARTRVPEPPLARDFARVDTRGFAGSGLQPVAAPEPSAGWLLLAAAGIQRWALARRRRLA